MIEKLKSLNIDDSTIVAVIVNTVKWRNSAGQHRAMRRQRDRIGRVCSFEEHPFAGNGVDIGSGVPIETVATKVIGAARVDTDQHHTHG